MKLNSLGLERTKRKLIFGISDYLVSFFPSLQWIPKYQREWLIGDLISGLTLGVMIVPQVIAYTRLAQIPVQYGLYSAFIGHLVYSFLGTSREISIGPLAVPGLIITNAIAEIMEKFPNLYTPEQIGASLAILFGLICAGFGIFRLGFIMDFIPNPVIVGFTTGIALSILLSQISSLFGIIISKSHHSTIETIKESILGTSQIVWQNFLFGIISLLFLFIMQFLSLKFGKKYPVISYLAIGSNAILVFGSTLISFLIFKLNPEFHLTIIKEVPNGFSYIGIPIINKEVWKQLITYIPGLFFAIALESSAIAKGFSRKGGYEIVPSQELFALGLSNIIGSFFSGFPSGGAVSRAAILDRSGVKTPLVGLFVSLLILTSFHFLTSLFYYIPNATLAAIIFKAALSLFPSKLALLKFWHTHPVDFVQFIMAALITFLFGAEYGIGSAVITGFLFLLYRIARPKVFELYKSNITPQLYLDKNTSVLTQSLVPGILAFKIQESLLFPNISYISQQIITQCLLSTRPTSMDQVPSIWSMNIYTKAHKLRLIQSKINQEPLEPMEKLPKLIAIILDLSSINWIDSTGFKGLELLFQQLQSYSGSELQGFIITTNPIIIQSLLRTKVGYIPINTFSELKFNQVTTTVDDTLNSITPIHQGFFAIYPMITLVLNDLYHHV